MNLRRYVVGFTFMLLAGCSGSTASTLEPSTSDDSTTSLADTDPETTETPTSQAPASSSVAPTSGPPASGPPTSGPPGSVAAAKPFGEPAEPSEPNDTSVYISRRLMTAESIELTWSAPEGAVEYQMHRLPRTTDQRPEGSAMTADNMIHSSGDEQGAYLDPEVTSGATYWYGMRSLDTNGELLATGWHRADAITDAEPPAQVELSLTVDNGEVMLSWNQPAENYELNGYQILRGVDGEELKAVSAAYSPDQTSFVDPEPPKGVVTYAVLALDFHWNKSELAEQTVEIG